MLGGAPPSGTAHFDSFYPSTPRQTLHGTSFSSVTRYRCFPLDFASFTPSSPAVFCLKLSLNPHTGLIRPGSGLRGRRTPAYSVYLSDGGILPPVTEALCWGGGEGFQIALTALTHVKQLSRGSAGEGRHGEV